MSPILYQGAKSTNAYFPRGTWYDFYSGQAIDASAAGAWHTVQVCSSSTRPLELACMCTRQGATTADCSQGQSGCFLLAVPKAVSPYAGC